MPILFRSYLFISIFILTVPPPHRIFTVIRGDSGCSQGIRPVVQEGQMHSFRLKGLVYFVAVSLTGLLGMSSEFAQEKTPSRRGALTPPPPSVQLAAHQESEFKGIGRALLADPDYSLIGSHAYPVMPGKFKYTSTDPWTVGDFQAQLFSDNYTGLGRPGSLRDYFRDASFNNFLVGGTVAPWVRVAQTNTYYEGPSGCNGLCTPNPQNAGGFIKEVLALQDANINFAQYDNDGPDGVPNSGDDDGFVDFAVFVQAMEGGECDNANRIWSHSWVYSGWWGAPYQTLDAAAGGGYIKVEKYYLGPALSCGTTSMIEIGGFAFQFALHFGLPSLSDDDSSSVSVGIWDLMASGYWGADGDSPERPVMLSAWSREQLGWLEPTVLTSSRLNELIPPVETNAVAYRVTRPSGCSRTESFLIENRQQIKWDSLLPGSGLLVWHVDDSRPNNTDEARPILALVQADGFFNLEAGYNSGDAGDPFPGSSNRTAWSATTTPSSHFYDGIPSGFSLANVSASGNPMTADLLVEGGALFHPRTLAIDDTQDGDGDGVLDPGETVLLPIALGNEGRTAASTPTGTLAIDPPVTGVQVADAAADWPDLALCGIQPSTSPHFSLALSYDVGCEVPIPMSLNVTSGQGSSTSSLDLRTGTWFAGGEVRLSNASDNSWVPQAVWNGNGWGVVFQDWRTGLSEIYMARLDSTGQLLGETKISAGTGDSYLPRVAWNGTNYGVVWTDTRNGNYEIYFALVNSSGSRVGTELRVTSNSYTSDRPDIDWAGDHWGVVWADTRGNGAFDVYYARIGAGGSKETGDVRITTSASNSYATSLAWNGTRHGVTYFDGRSGSWEIYFVGLDRAGAIVLPEVQVTTNTGPSWYPRIAWDAGSNRFVIVYTDYETTAGRILLSKVTASGTVDGSPSLVTAGQGKVDDPDVESDGTHTYVCWTDYREGRRDVTMTRMDVGGPIAEVPVSSTAALVTFSSLAAGGGKVGVFWDSRDTPTGTTDIWSRLTWGRFDCLRDDDGDHIGQNIDNCPDVSNPDQVDSDTDLSGDACDCQPNDLLIHPGAVEVCANGADDDCDGMTDSCDPFCHASPGGSWFDLAWGSRRSLRISNSGATALTDYQVRIELTAANFNFAAALSDGADLRVSGEDGVTLLPYWLQDYDASGQHAVLWVRVPLIPAGGGVNLFLYSGNPAALSAANPQAVFEFFEGFDGTAVDSSVWTETDYGGGGTATVAGGFLTLTAGASGQGFTELTSQARFGVGTILESRARHRDAAGDSQVAGELGYGTADRSNLLRLADYNNAKFVLNEAKGGSVGAWLPLDLPIDTLWRIHRIYWESSTNVLFEIDGVTRADGSKVPTTTLPVWLFSFAATGRTNHFDVDWVLIRKWAATPPQVTTCGSAVEQLPAACSTELCDGQDNDCDGLTDEGFLDRDGDGIANCVDNCRKVVNSDQVDTDADGTGDACDDCFGSGIGYEICDNGVDDDCDGRGDDCDDACRPPATGNWMDPAWSYRVPLRLDNTAGSALSAYPVWFHLDEDFPFGLAASDGRDLRLTLADGRTPAQWWIERWDSLAQDALIWIKPAQIAAGSESLFYLYFGNPSAVEAPGDPKLMFELWDDFPGTALDTLLWREYDHVAGGDVEVHDGMVTLTSSPAGRGYVCILSAPVFGPGHIFEAYARHRDATGGEEVAGECGFSDEEKYYALRLADYMNPNFAADATRDGSMSGWQQLGLPVDQSWHLHRIYWAASDRATFDIDGDATTITDYIPDRDLPAWLMSFSLADNTNHFDVDWVRIRPMSDQDPGVGVCYHEPKPGGCAAESCNGLDDDCDGTADEDFADTDTDGWADCFDNCPTVYNPSQADEDSDGTGNACDYQAGQETCDNGFDDDGDGAIDLCDRDCRLPIGESWMDLDWSHRTAVLVRNTGTSILDQFQIRLDLSALSFDFSHGKNDGSDLRVTAEDGQTSLTFFIESYDASLQTGAIWVRMPYLAPGVDTVIYLYSGNPDVLSSPSDPSGVFDLYDAFGGSALETSRWTEVDYGSGGTPTVGDGVLTLTTSSLGTGYVQLLSKSLFGPGTMVEARVRHRDAAGDGRHAGEWGFSDTARDSELRIADYHLPQFLVNNKSAGSGGSTWIPMGVPLDQLWHNERVTWFADRVVYDLDQTRVTVSLNVPQTSLSVWLFSHSTTGNINHFDVDWVRARKAASVEPVPTLCTAEAGPQDCGPIEVSCNGLDDNCNGWIDENDPDTDQDQIPDCLDSCPLDTLNDLDGDTICGSVDNCPSVANVDQLDTDEDGTGDACDSCTSGFPEICGNSQDDDCDGLVDDCDSDCWDAGDGTWLDAAWSHRATLRLGNGNATTLSQYQVRLALGPDQIDFGVAALDGRDVRVTSADGVTPQPYWIESWDSTGQQAVVWVRPDALPAGEETLLFLYFGNPSSGPTTGNPEAVFELFDDFATVDPAVWTEVDFLAGGNVSCDGTMVTLTAVPAGRGYVELVSTSLFGPGHAFEARARHRDALGDGRRAGELGFADAARTNMIRVGDYYLPTFMGEATRGGVSGGWQPMLLMVHQDWAMHQVLWYSTDRADLKIDSTTLTLTGSIPATAIPAWLFSYSASGYTNRFDVDWVRVRKLATQEPVPNWCPSP